MLSSILKYPDGSMVITLDRVGPAGKPVRTLLLWSRWQRREA